MLNNSMNEMTGMGIYPPFTLNYNMNFFMNPPPIASMASNINPITSLNNICPPMNFLNNSMNTAMNSMHQQYLSINPFMAIPNSNYFDFMLPPHIYERLMNSN